MVDIVVATVGNLLVGSMPIAVCAVVFVPMWAIHVLMGGKDMGPQLNIPLEKGLRLVLAMGQDGTVTIFSSDW